jgi:hypothetical protein
MNSINTLERILGIEHKLEKTTNRQLGTYLYRGCYIAKSIGATWFVHCANSDVAQKLPKGVRAKTRKELLRQIDDYLNQAGPSVS